MIVGIALFTFLLNRYLQNENDCYWWDRTKLKLSLVVSIFERTLLGRFAHSFSMTLVSGVPLTSALNSISEAVDNAFMANRILNMCKSI